MTAQNQLEIFNFLQTATGWINGYRSHDPVPECTDTILPVTRKILDAEIQSCTRCPLSIQRIPRQLESTSEATGTSTQALVILFKKSVTDNPEKLINGPQGALLERMLTAIQLDPKQNCCITTIIKCPSGSPNGSNGPYSHTEISCQDPVVLSCLPWIKSQIQTLLPKAVLILGTETLQALGYGDKTLSTLHCQVLNLYGVPAVATWDPADILRDASLKRPVWEVLQKLRQILNQQDSYLQLTR